MDLAGLGCGVVVVGDQAVQLLLPFVELGRAFGEQVVGGARGGALGLVMISTLGRPGQHGNRCRMAGRRDKAAAASALSRADEGSARAG